MLGPVPVVAQGAITAFALSPLSPNPSPGHSLVTVAIPARTWVRLTLTDVQGREVAVLADGIRQAGRYTAALDASGLRAGMYSVCMQAQGVNLTRRLAVVKWPRGSFPWIVRKAAPAWLRVGVVAPGRPSPRARRRRSRYFSTAALVVHVFAPCVRRTKYSPGARC